MSRDLTHRIYSVKPFRSAWPLSRAALLPRGNRKSTKRPNGAPMPIPGRSRNLIVLHSRRKGKKEDGPEVDQLQLETALLKRRELREIEESIAIALSKGARVEPGVHTAQLVPE